MSNSASWGIKAATWMNDTPEPSTRIVNMNQLGRALLEVQEVAERLVAEQGVEGLCMGDVAGAAGVGVGTLYRRFGDRAGLAYALTGNLTAAREEFAHAGRAAAAFNSGMVNLAQRNWDGASKDFLDAFAADPSLRSAAMRARQAWSMKNGGPQ